MGKGDVKSREFVHPMQSSKRVSSLKLLCKAIRNPPDVPRQSRSVISYHNIKDTILVSALLKAKEGLVIRLCTSPPLPLSLLPYQQSEKATIHPEYAI